MELKLCITLEVSDDYLEDTGFHVFDDNGNTIVKWDELYSGIRKDVIVWVNLWAAQLKELEMKRGGK